MATSFRHSEPRLALFVDSALVPVDGEPIEQEDD